MLSKALVIHIWAVLVNINVLKQQLYLDFNKKAVIIPELLHVI